MSADLVIFLIRAGMQVGTEGIKALEQQARDADLRAPDIELARVSETRRMVRLFQNELAREVADGGPLAEFWKSTPPGAPKTSNPESLPRLLERARGFWREQRERERAKATTLELGLADADEGINRLAQWNESDAPPPPYVRVVLSLARVALEFARGNPALLGVGSDGETFAIVVAERIEEMIPSADNPEDWEPKDRNRYYFAERTLSILLHAGLATLNRKPDMVVNEAHLQALVVNMTEPLVALFDESSSPLTLLRLQQTLLGPVAQSAFATLADHQVAFLGRSFERDKAVGSVTAAVLGVVRGKSLQALADDGTLVTIARAAIGVAVKRPELFVHGEGSAENVARTLLSRIASTINKNVADDGVFLSDGFVTDVAVAALDVLAEEGPSLVEGDDPWENVAAEMVSVVAKGMSRSLGEEGTIRFERIFSRAQAVELVRVVLSRAARTPGMLTGNGRKEVGIVVSAIASAMAADEKLLLGAGDWHRIASVAARAAAQNPGRLFRLDVGKPEGQLGTRIIRTILVSAADGFDAAGPRSGSLGFGEVLVDAVDSAYRAALANLEAASAAVMDPDDDADGGDFAAIGNLVRAVNAYAEAHPDRVGAEEWRWLFGNLVLDAIEQGADLDLTDATFEALLKGRRAGAPAPLPDPNEG